MASEVDFHMIVMIISLEKPFSNRCDHMENHSLSVFVKGCDRCDRSSVVSVLVLEKCFAQVALPMAELQVTV